MLFHFTEAQKEKRIKSLPPIVQQEKNPEALKYLLGSVYNENKRLKKEIRELKKQEAKKAQLCFGFDEKLNKFKKMLFGKSSEKRKLSIRYRKKREKKIELEGERLVPPPKEEERKGILEIVSEHRLTKEELGDIAVEHAYPRESEWRELNIYDKSFRVHMKPQRVVREENRAIKYVLVASEKKAKTVMVSADKPKPIVPGSSYSPQFAVEVLSLKYLYHLPLERIRRMLESQGLKIQAKTLYNLCFFVSMYLEEIAEKIKEEIRKSNRAVHIDETPWPINNSEQKDGYMWVLSYQGGSFYHFANTRSAVIAKELLGSYRGPVVTDGFASYKAHLEKELSLAGCWAHARRKFTDIEENYPKECQQVLELMAKLFQIEKKAETYEELKALREKESKVIVGKLRKLYYEFYPATRPQSALRKAIDYSLKNWKSLTVFLENEKVPLTNNEAERTIRHAVMGRKNYHGSRTYGGARVASLIYTIVESCKKVELDPKDYILKVVENSIKKKPVLTPFEYVKKIRN